MFDIHDKLFNLLQKKLAVSIKNWSSSGNSREQVLWLFIFLLYFLCLQFILQVICFKSSWLGWYIFTFSFTSWLLNCFKSNPFDIMLHKVSPFYRLYVPLCIFFYCFMFIFPVYLHGYIPLVSAEESSQFDNFFMFLS